MILVGSVASERIVICFDPAEDHLPNLIPFHGDAVKSINQLFLSVAKNFPSAHCQNSNVCVPCSDEWIHAERAAHGIPDWCIGCHDQNEGSNRAHNHSGKLHGETHRSISSRAYEGTLHNRLQRHQNSQNCSKIQLTVCTFDFGHIADVLRSGRRCGKIPSYQIIILRCMKISLCQAMRTLFAY